MPSDHRALAEKAARHGHHPLELDLSSSRLCLHDLAFVTSLARTTQCNLTKLDVSGNHMPKPNVAAANVLVRLLASYPPLVNLDLRGVFSAEGVMSRRTQDGDLELLVASGQRVAGRDIGGTTM